MKATKLAGLLVVLLAGVAAASTAEVTWTVSLYVGDYNGVAVDKDNIDLNIPADGGYWVYWKTSVTVTGDNQGLGAFVVDIGTWNSEGVIAQRPMVYGVNEADSYLAWAKVYDVMPAGGGDPVGISDVATANAGGPGMANTPLLGSVPTGPNEGKAFINQQGAAYPSPYVARKFTTAKTGGSWSGTQMWGVGLDSMKSKLLASGQETYDVATGWFSLSGSANGVGNWDAGTWTVQISVDPAASLSASVLRSGLNLNVDYTSGITDTVARSDIHSVGGSFTIIPEPTTLLLLAGAGLLYRRRRA